MTVPQLENLISTTKEDNLGPRTKEIRTNNIQTKQSIFHQKRNTLKWKDYTSHISFIF